MYEVVLTIDGKRQVIEIEETDDPEAKRAPKEIRAGWETSDDNFQTTTLIEIQMPAGTPICDCDHWVCQSIRLNLWRFEAFPPAEYPERWRAKPDQN